MTFAELKAAIAAYIERDDMAERIPLWVRMSQAEMSRRIAHPEMETYATAPMTEGQFILPERCTKVLNIEPSEGAGPLRFVERTTFDGLNERTGDPSAYTIQGRTVITYPSLGDATVELRLRLSLEELTDDTDTDWVLSEYPDAYVYGATAHGFLHLLEEQRAAVARAMFERTLGEINSQSAEQMSGPLLTLSPSVEIV